MQLTETDNQAYFDKTKAREKTCAGWLKEQSKAVRKPILLAAIAGISNGLGVIIQSALLAFMLQAIIIDKLPWASLMTPFMVLAAVFILRSVCVYWQQTWGFEAGAHVRASVRKQLFDTFLTLGPAGLKQRQSGELAAVTLEQVDALENYFTRYLPQQMIVGVLPLIMIIVVMPVNWVVGLDILVNRAAGAGIYGVSRHGRGFRKSQPVSGDGENERLFSGSFARTGDTQAVWPG